MGKPAAIFTIGYYGGPVQGVWQQTVTAARAISITAMQAAAWHKYKKYEKKRHPFCKALAQA
jgi:hypothetical protein